MSKPPDWTYLAKPTKPAKKEVSSNPSNWSNSAAKWISGEDQSSYPPNWILEVAYEQASSNKPAGNRAAALSLLNMLTACLLEKGEFRLTPIAREILGSMLTAILEGTEPATAMFLEEKSGQSRWINHQRDNDIATSMMVRTAAGIKAAPAARELAQSGKYTDPKNGKPLSAKRITNIWNSYKKNSWSCVSFGDKKAPE